MCDAFTFSSIVRTARYQTCRLRCIEWGKFVRRKSADKHLSFNAAYVFVCSCALCRTCTQKSTLHDSNEHTLYCKCVLYELTLELCTESRFQARARFVEHQLTPVPACVWVPRTSVLCRFMATDIGKLVKQLVSGMHTRLQSACRCQPHRSAWLSLITTCCCGSMCTITWRLVIEHCRPTMSGYLYVHSNYVSLPQIRYTQDVSQIRNVYQHIVNTFWTQNTNTHLHMHHPYELANICSNTNTHTHTNRRIERISV